jgi:hypothetical protein
MFMFMETRTVYKYCDNYFGIELKNNEFTQDGLFKARSDISYRLNLYTV